jgi:hypothetical protein
MSSLESVLALAEIARINPAHLFLEIGVISILVL